MSQNARRRFHQVRLWLWIAQVPTFAAMLYFDVPDRYLVIYLAVISIWTGIEGPITSLEANTDDG